MSPTSPGTTDELPDDHPSSYFYAVQAVNRNLAKLKAVRLVSHQPEHSREERIAMWDLADQLSDAEHRLRKLK